MLTQPIPKANPEEIRQLLQRYSCPAARERATDWPGLARALVGIARRYGIHVPLYLAHAAGFRQPPPPLRLVRAGTRDDDGLSNAHPFFPVP